MSKNLLQSISALFFLLVMASNPLQLKAQCCNFTNSGQNIDSLPTFGTTLGDIDGDGDEDVFTVNAYVNMQIFKNNGNGVYTLNQTITPTGGEESNFEAELVDVDGDNDLDAVVIPFYNSTSIKIYKNNGSGGFTLFQSISANIGARHAGVADLDNDGDVDILIPGWMGPNVGVFKNNGAGYFLAGSALSLSNFGGTNHVAIADFDGDGDKDAVVVSSSQGGRLLVNNGSGIFTDNGQTIGNTADSYHACAAGDLDKDGDADLVFGCMYGPLTIILNDAGTFTVLSTYPSSNYDMDMKILDYDYDNDPDIFVSTYGSQGLEVWSNDGEANLSLCYENVSPMPGTYSHGFDIGLINNDLYYDAFMGQFGGDGDKVFFGAPGYVITPSNITICQGESYTFPDGFVGDSSMVHISQFTASNGCDSNIVTALTVTPVNVGITLSQNTFSASASNASYQWVNCSSGYVVIPNATSQAFTATQSGYYAVIVTQNGCSDTSMCLQVVGTGLADADQHNIQVYPNPANDNLYVNMGNDNRMKTIRISDLCGKVLIESQSNSTGIKPINLNKVKPGMYLLRITVENKLIAKMHFIKG
jgi:hypothetical protein